MSETVEADQAPEGHGPPSAPSSGDEAAPIPGTAAWHEDHASLDVARAFALCADVTGDEEFRYSFLNNGNANAAATYEVPSALGTLRNGLPPGRMLRREFRALVSLRDYNY